MDEGEKLTRGALLTLNSLSRLLGNGFSVFATIHFLPSLGYLYDVATVV